MERNVRRRSKAGFGRVTIASGRDRYDIRCEIYQASVEEITITVFSQKREREGREWKNERVNKRKESERK